VERREALRLIFLEYIVFHGEIEQRPGRRGAAGQNVLHQPLTWSDAYPAQLFDLIGDPEINWHCRLLSRNGKRDA
jgi:hypothetical protein